MKIGEIIREHRKRANLTQEEMAGRLGVSAPAVNKWEKGRSLPDVALLAPIARLLGITTDALLAYEAELAREEIDAFEGTLQAALETRPFAEAFDMARRKLAEYPNCEALAVETCALLEAWRTMHGDEGADFDGFLLAHCQRLLDSRSPEIRRQAADTLYIYYYRSERYAEAEATLAQRSEDDPERRLRQADIFAATGRGEEAAKAYEELLFNGYGAIIRAMQGRCLASLRAGELSEARYWVGKQSALAALFEMGEYHEASPYLELALAEEDAAGMAEVAVRLLRGAETILGFTRAPMYRHMRFRDAEPAYLSGLKEDLLAGFREEGERDFLKDSPEWRALMDRWRETGDAD